MNFFTGKRIVIATMHQKERVIGKLFKEAFGVETFVPLAFDTDIFGTFTRDVKRKGSQLEAARAKARAALKETGADLALASEGSFSPHPSFPFASSNLELVILLDQKNDIEVRGHFETFETRHIHKKVFTVKDAISFAKEIGFPEQGIIVRKSETSKKIYKDISTWQELEDLVIKLLSGFFTKNIFLETDMRAHKNPTRMKVIEKATLDLIKNIQSTCPNCDTIGYVKTKFVRGLPCSLCGGETEKAGTFLYECQKCDKKEEKTEGDFAEPEECPSCNP